MTQTDSRAGGFSFPAQRPDEYFHQPHCREATVNDRLTMPESDRAEPAPLIDALGRQISYLRMSVTDRCDLRCFYCKGDDVRFLPKSEILSLEELDRIATAFVGLGVRKLRLTGGEPLMRPGIDQLIARLGRHVASGALGELTLTTNGTHLARHAEALVAAGLRRVNVSLDSLDRWNFERITHRDELPLVLAGIAAARSAGLAVRINAVAMAGINDHEFDAMIRWCGDQGCDMALIEVMPLGNTMEHYLPLDAVRAELARHWTLMPIAYKTGGPARYWQVAETGRRIAFIAPMSHGFCATCNRLRLTCTGRVVLCLGNRLDFDLRPALRAGRDDSEIEAAIRAAVAAKPAGHSFAVGTRPVQTRPMWQLGG
jgi:cyclic pyranopterin phosphate synthase